MHQEQLCRKLRGRHLLFEERLETCLERCAELHGLRKVGFTPPQTSWQVKLAATGTA
jgi:hypothetical protein